MHRRTLLKTIAAGAATSAAPWAAAQALSDQPLRWIVPYPAGGGTDVLARTVAEAMRVSMGQQIVIDNRPGASTNIGAQIVATAKPDGTTFMSADNAVLAFNEHLFSKLPFSPEKDFTYVGGISRFPLALVVHPGFEAQTLKDFIAYAKAHPGKINYASPGNGSPHHLAMEMFKLRTGTFMTHIPYRGSGPAVADVLAGQVQVFITTPPSVMQHVVSGKLKAFAVTGTKRHPGLPNVPTVAEAGMPDFKLEAWVGLFAPAATPPAVVAKLTADVKKALDMPETRQRADAAGIELRYLPPDALGELVKTETAYWAKTIKAAGIKAD